LQATYNGFDDQSVFASFLFTIEKGLAQLSVGSCVTSSGGGAGKRFRFDLIAFYAQEVFGSRSYQHARSTVAEAKSVAVRKTFAELVCEGKR
jgi:hypothetical protein